MRNLDITFDHVDSVHACSQTGHGFCQDATATTDIEHAESGQRLLCFVCAPEVVADFLVQIAYAQSIQSMQGPEAALFVPPLLGEPGVKGYFLRIDGRVFIRSQARNSARVMCLALKAPPSAVVWVRELASITPRDLTQ